MYTVQQLHTVACLSAAWKHLRQEFPCRRRYEGKKGKQFFSPLAGQQAKKSSLSLQKTWLGKRNVLNVCTIAPRAIRYTDKATIVSDLGLLCVYVYICMYIRNTHSHTCMSQQYLLRLLRARIIAWVYLSCLAVSPF